MKGESVDRRVVWSRLSVIEDLQAAHRAGIPINTNGLAGYKRGLVRAAQIRFGNLRHAAEIAGVPYRETTYRTPERVIEELHKLNAAGVRMRAREIYALRQGLAYASKKHFGSIQAAVAAAGLKYAGGNLLPPTNKKRAAERPLLRVETTRFCSVEDEYRHKYKMSSATGRRPRCGYF